MARVAGRCHHHPRSRPRRARSVAPSTAANRDAVVVPHHGAGRDAPDGPRRGSGERRDDRANRPLGPRIDRTGATHDVGPSRPPEPRRTHGGRGDDRVGRTGGASRDAGPRLPRSWGPTDSNGALLRRTRADPPSTPPRPLANPGADIPRLESRARDRYAGASTTAPSRTSMSTAAPSTTSGSGGRNDCPLNRPLKMVISPPTSVIWGQFDR